MINKAVIIVGLLIKISSTQSLFRYQPPIIAETIFETSSNLASTTNSLCKDLSAAIQNVVLSNFQNNICMKPIFSNMAGPLLSDIGGSCKCPSCNTIKIGASGYSTGVVSNNEIADLISRADSVLCVDGPPNSVTEYTIITAPRCQKTVQCSTNNAVLPNYATDFVSPNYLKQVTPSNLGATYGSCCVNEVCSCGKTTAPTTVPKILPPSLISNNNVYPNYIAPITSNNPIPNYASYYRQENFPCVNNPANNYQPKLAPVINNPCASESGSYIGRENCPCGVNLLNNNAPSPCSKNIPQNYVALPPPSVWPIFPSYSNKEPCKTSAVSNCVNIPSANSFASQNYAANYNAGPSIAPQTVKPASDIANNRYLELLSGASYSQIPLNAGSNCRNSIQ